MCAISKEERRRQLLQAALETFGAHGYHQTQISDIIKHARVARGTFYLYFPSKREIFDSLMTELFDRVRNEVKSLPREAVTEIPAQLLGNIDRITGLLLDNPLLARILFNESVGLDEEFDRRLKLFYGQLLDLIRRGLRQGQEMGFVCDGDIRVMAIALMGALKEIFYQLQLQTEDLSREVISREFFHFVVRAIARPEIGKAVLSAAQPK